MELHRVYRSTKNNQTVAQIIREWHREGGNGTVRGSATERGSDTVRGSGRVMTTQQLSDTIMWQVEVAHMSIDVGGAGGDMGRRRSTASTHSQSGSSSPSSARKRRQHCTYCKNHDRQTRKSNHRCIYETCSCLLCQLTRVSRLIMRHQQRLWRHLKDTNRREHPDMDGGGVVGSSKQQKCDMCRNHGVMKEKRAHKNACPYQDCDCSLCGLTRKRRDIMRHQQRVRRSKVVTRELQDEVYDYVIKTTEELAKLSQESDLPEPAALEPPALPPPYSHHDPAPQVHESARPPTPPSPMSLSPPCPSSPQAPSRGVVVPPREPSSLESLVVPEPHHDPEAGLEGLGGSAWRNFKREREDSTAAVTFTPLPQVRHDVGFSVSLGACRAPTLTPPPAFCPADTLGPYKKTRMASTSQDLPITTPSAFWATGHLEAFNSHCPDLYSPGYRRLPPVSPIQTRPRSPPGLIPLPQPQPLRPRPVTPLRPPILTPSGELDPVSLPYLAYSLLHTRALPPPHLGFNRVSPFLYHSVP